MRPKTSLFLTRTLLLSLLFTLTACGEEAVTESSFMMDTVITYKITADNAEALIDDCDSMITELESRLSAHIETSEVGIFNDSASVNLSIDTKAITSLALDIYKNTNGAFDITVAPLVSLWNIAHGKDGWTPPNSEDVDALLPFIGSDKLMLTEDTLSKSSIDTKIDLGGIAKGYALGVCAEYLYKNGAVGTLSFGGSIAVIGRKSDGEAWVIGIKDPISPDKLCGEVSLETGVISVSGGYERFREHDGIRYHHILDPQTGYPSSSDLACAVVICPSANPLSGALCDALSTALFVMGKDASLSLYGSGIYNFEAILITNDGIITVTKGLEGRFTSYESEA